MYKITESEALRMYDWMLNGAYGTVEVAGFTYDTSRALQRIDLIEYLAGFSDYMDMLEGFGYEIVEG